MTTVDDRFVAALSGSDPLNGLQSTVQHLVDQGESPETLYERLRSFALALRAAGRDADEDVVFDMLDILAGWCSPTARIVVADRAE